MTDLRKILVANSCVTWVNHYSVLQLMKAGIDINQFTSVGVDGFFLRLLIDREASRSSADADLPMMFIEEKLSVGLLGGNAKHSEDHKSDFEAHFPKAKVLWSFDGFGESREPKSLKAMRDMAPDVVLIGMGPLAQEIEASFLRDFFSQLGSKVHIFTCGAWLDQLASEEFYPSWAKKTNLRWLIRLAREPNRLWKRYLFWPLVALLQKSKIQRYLQDVNLI